MISYRGASGQIWYELERYPDEVVLVQADYRGGPGTDGEMFTLLHPDEFARLGFVSLGAVPEEQANELRKLHIRRLTNYRRQRSAIPVVHSQALRLLASTDRSGRDLRTALGELGHVKRLAAFYLMMSKLEEARLVVGYYKPKTVAGHQLKERWYSITVKGIGVVAEQPTRAVPGEGSKV